MSRVQLLDPRLAKLRLLALAVLCSLFAVSITHVNAQAAPGTILEIRPTGTMQPAEIQRAGAPLFESFGVPAASYAVDTYLLRYATTDFDGSPAEVTAQLFVPRFDAPTERPVYVFGSGTTGLIDRCAPSLEQPEVLRLGHYRANMLAYAGHGFIGIMPDYLGFHDDARPQRYFSAKAEAHVMLDAIRAVYNFFDTNETVVRLSQDVFTSGYSQGGHAAFAAADLRPEYAPEVPLSGVIGYGATTNVTTLLKEGPYYAPYIVYTYALKYGTEAFNPAEILDARYAGTLATDVLRMCVDGIQTYYPFDGNKMYNPAFAASLYGGTLQQTHPSIFTHLTENHTGLSGHGLPALIVHGEQDIIVTTPAQTEFVQALCQAGSPVHYLRMDGVRHRHTRPAGFRASVSWMEAIAQGETPPSDCTTVLAEQ
jgi:pimeloyl-ACP methyl ester carboxylesterase